MPHKHVRARDGDKSKYDLPPTKVARPLPVGKQGQSVFTDDQERKRKAKKRRDYQADDTPKAFARLMQRQAGIKPLNALDNGDRVLKKRKRQEENKDNPAQEKKKPVSQPAPKAEVPKILPGEKMSEFSARVNQMLPVSGLTRKGKAGLGPKEGQTRTEKRMQKMYAEWREEDARRKEKLEEEQERAEEEDDDDEGEEKKVELPTIGKKRRKRMIGEEKDTDDPWAELKLKRDAPKGLHDVAQAPPEFKNIPREKFKVRNGAVAHVADIPNAAGSLKRREELSSARQSIIEQYRALMKKNAVT